MKEINLRDFYPWYMEDVMVEVTEEVAEELLAGQRYIKASRRRVYRNKAHFSLDAEDGIEYSACFSNPSPQELIERMERFEYLCHALNSLPDAQGQRVFEHYLLGHSVKAIAAAEGVKLPDDQVERHLARLAHTTDDSTSSLSRDFDAGRVGEMELFSGEAVRMAQAHGIDAPVTCRYYEGLKERAAAFSK